jgi:RNA polymerase sigma factor (sigma-70 family)
MQSTDDSALLRQYLEEHSDAAFATLVTRHINLVYSVALRHVGDPHQAEEITQAVFILLTRKAAQLRHHKALSSWLFQATRLTASNFVRGETRRHRREQEAHMQVVLDESGTDVWRQIAPLLDSAVASLSEKDRQAIVLRFYEGRNLRDVGAALGASEDAAEKRVSRAVERLREFFTKRGVTAGASGLAVVMSANAVQAAPVGLAATLSSAALAGAATSSGTTFTLVKLMTMTKIKTGVISSIVVAGAVTSLVIQQQSQAKIRESDGALQQQSDQLARLQTGRERLASLLARANGPAADDRLSELLRLRAEAAILSQQTNDLAALQEENRRLREQNSQLANPVKTPLQLKEESYARSLYARDWLLAFRVFAMQNQEQFPTNFEQAASFLPDAVAKAATNITTDQFEIVYNGSYELTNGNNVIVLREKQARQQWPHGNWSKVYGFADGHSEIHGEAEDNFDAWEKQRIVTPANQ